MISHLLANTETGDLPVHDKLARQLDQAFGTSFCYWVLGEDRWRPMDEVLTASDSRAYADSEALVAAALAADGESRIMDDTDLEQPS